MSNPTLFFEDGDDVPAFLAGAGPGPRFDAGQRYLMLLDIRLPRVGGLEVLRRVRTDERLTELPVIMLTTTEEPDEVAAAHALGCAGFLTKPVRYARFAEVVRRIGLTPFLDAPRDTVERPGER